MSRTSYNREIVVTSRSPGNYRRSIGSTKVALIALARVLRCCQRGSHGVVHLARVDESIVLRPKRRWVRHFHMCGDKGSKCHEAKEDGILQLHLHLEDL